MDEESQARYAVLFANYGEVSAMPAVASGQAKQVILRFIDERGPFLRSDAALMLLSTYDNMIARPFTLGHGLASADLQRYFGVTNAEGLSGEIAAPSRRAHEVVEESIEDLSQILSWLYDLGAGAGRQVDARDVITGIDQLWGKLHIAAFGKWVNPGNLGNAGRLLCQCCPRTHIGMSGRWCTTAGSLGWVGPCFNHYWMVLPMLPTVTGFPDDRV